MAKKLGRVDVKPMGEGYMNWPLLRSMKGDGLADEMRDGLMRRLWDRRAVSTSRSTPYDTEGSVLDDMSKRWHLDGVALNYELGSIFAAGAPLVSSQHWGVHGVEVEQIEKSKVRAKDQVIFP